MITKKRQKEIRKRADLHIDAANLLVRAIFNEHSSMSDTSLAYILGDKGASERYKEELEFITDYVVSQIKDKWGIK